MAHVSVMVPEGHTIQIHPPGHVSPAGEGMIHDPAHAGALAAMNAAMPLPNEQALTPKDAEQPKRKAKPKSDKKEVEKPSGEPRAKGKK